MEIPFYNKVYPYILVCPYEVHKGKPSCFIKIPAEIVQYKCTRKLSDVIHSCTRRHVQQVIRLQGFPDLVGSRPKNLGLKTTKGPNSKF